MNAELFLRIFAVSIMTSGVVARSNAGPENVPEEWQIRTERTGFRETCRYDETIEFCKRLADASDWIHHTTFGKTPVGRDLPLVIASTGGEFDVRKARASGKRIVLVQNAIHPGECDGKDAALMLLRDIAITKQQAHLLQNVVLLVIPIYNVDGYERFGPYNRINQNGPEAMGWRATAQNLNLNRDYMKADAPETRAWLKLFNEWLPDLHLDTHATNGGDWQYDMMPAWERSAVAPTTIVEWMEKTLRPNLYSGLIEDGHEPIDYFGLVDRWDLEKGIRSGPFDPRFSNGYVAIRNRASILVESHMLKSHRTRVMGQYSVLRHSLEITNRYGDSLGKAIATADAQAAGFGRSFDPDRKIAISARSSSESEPITFKGYAVERRLSEVSGSVWLEYDRSRPALYGIPHFNQSEVAKDVVPPVAYVIPPQWGHAIEVIEAHGLQTRRLSAPRTLSVEGFHLTEPKFGARPYEGRFRVSFAIKASKEDREFPAGSVVVPLDQPGARVAIHLLEPEAPDSLVAWGFFNAIFEQKEYAEGYVLEKMAREMMDGDPKLRKEFEDKITRDPDFAKDPRARLYFFYQRTPYWDKEFGRYPVARILSGADLAISVSD